jgi:hypothetical protein
MSLQTKYRLLRKNKIKACINKLIDLMDLNAYEIEKIPLADFEKIERVIDNMWLSARPYRERYE